MQGPAPQGGWMALAHCRAGFEAEATQDLAAVAAAARSTFDSVPDVAALAAARIDSIDATRWRRALERQPPVFARSVFLARHPLAFGRDRIAPVLQAARDLAPAFSTLWLETPDTNDGKLLSGMCRRLEPLLAPALRDAGLLTSDVHAPRLHVLFTGRDRGYVGCSHPQSGSRWAMGIPRVRMPREAPSRSALKLAEAFITFLGDEETAVLRPGMRAVDLGAAPGGWSWQLADRGLRVVAVDNGPLKGSVADDPLVTHVRADGFSYRPRRPVDWMVCDMVEKPARIALLVAQWIARGDARRCVFNLKLPMKKRYDEVLRCRRIIGETLERADVEATLALRQLYHDREEVTGYLERRA